MSKTMMQPSGLWSSTVKHGEVVELSPAQMLVITNAALAFDLNHTSARTTLKFAYTMSDTGKLKTVTLNTFVIGVSEQFECNLLLEPGSIYLFESAGNNDIHLIGHYLEAQTARLTRTTSMSTRAQKKGQAK
ncbi:hypothetical protein NLJ89_g11920 [Agrocybe chaxingu]|uniref:Nucleoplasmin-like domain-containing protein n=1 Tax=Agrocybe chaxingu TaxID=84603 RepID=A0A9W8MQR0_9AGAR|nr:hypothetical protein NLJ89_g11920 [Agrocybe chaxingu]